MYPEHEKLEAIHDVSQGIGSFFDWLRDERHTCLMRYTGDENERPRYTPVNDLEQLMAEFFGIDLRKLENEKRQMLKQFQAQMAAAADEAE